MSNEKALGAGAEAQQRLTSQVNMFIFDLKNEAVEHGFKTGESWNLEMVSDAEITGLKRSHHPVILLRPKPDTLLKVYQQVKEKLQQALNKTEDAFTEIDLVRDGKINIAAYPSRISRK
ncbi:hypothetical protein [Mucilaginibacter sp. dw_454]|uniref:hypothetical protein n=1 Tax=Mucilaginibacter sp. dw_454 TaxID=2720079 RepID=UPI001BD62BC6|nr:hypothetical protein [Mucilaginibacter sp. dw_454]